jgi:outer membrane protein
MAGYVVNIISVNRLIIPILFVFWLSFPVNSLSETLLLTLDDSIQIALKNNPQIDIAYQQYRGSEGIITQTRSRYLPHLGTGLSYGRVHVEGSHLVDEASVGMGLLEVSQLIYDFGKTTGLINASAYGRDAPTIENLKQIYHNVVFSVKSSFYSVLESKRLITVAEQAVFNYEQQLYRAQRYFQAGVRTRIDVTNAEVNLSRQKLALLRANSNLKVAKTNFELVLGAKPNRGSYDIKVKEVQLESLVIQKPNMPGPLENLLVSAQKNRPGLE